MQTPVTIIVLGGGFTQDGSIPEWVRRRLEYAVSLACSFAVKPRLILSGGGLFRGTSEAEVMTRCVPSSFFSSIVLESNSWDTIQNAYFCRTRFLKNSSSVFVVTSEFHRRRTEQIFAHVFGSNCAVTVFGVYDGGLPTSQLRFRKQHEKRLCKIYYSVLEKHIRPGDLSTFEQFVMDVNSSLRIKYSRDVEKLSLKNNSLY